MMVRWYVDVEEREKEEKEQMYIDAEERPLLQVGVSTPLFLP